MRGKAVWPSAVRQGWPRHLASRIASSCGSHRGGGFVCRTGIATQCVGTISLVSWRWQPLCAAAKQGNSRRQSPQCRCRQSRSSRQVVRARASPAAGSFPPLRSLRCLYIPACTAGAALPSETLAKCRECTRWGDRFAGHASSEALWSRSSVPAPAHHRRMRPYLHSFYGAAPVRRLPTTEHVTTS